MKQKEFPDMFDLLCDNSVLKRERQKARDMRRTEWWKRQCAKGVCYYCKREFPSSFLTMDHIVPIVRGGKSVRGNIVPACKECNTKKQCLVPVEWEEYIATLSSCSV
ncbi:MAG: HNH endonuclease [Pseudomonadota bacterium]